MSRTASVFFDDKDMAAITEMTHSGKIGHLQALAAAAKDCGKSQESWAEYLAPAYTDGSRCYNAGHTVKAGHTVYTQYDVYDCPLQNCVYVNAILFTVKGQAFISQTTRKYSYRPYFE